MSQITARERAIRDVIAFLEQELERIRQEQQSTAPPAPVLEQLAGADDCMSFALRDAGFQRWLLRRQLEER